MSEMKTIDGFSVGDHVFVIPYDDLDVHIECCKNTIGGRKVFYGLHKKDIDSMAAMDDLYINSFFINDYKNSVDLHRKSTGRHIWYVTTDMLYPKEPDEIDVGDDLDSFMNELIAGGK